MASYFDVCYTRNAKVRWICKFLNYTGFLKVEKVRDLINEKIARIEKRRGTLDPESISRIAENLMWAKIVKRYLDRRLKPYIPKVRDHSPTHAFRHNFPAKDFTYEMSNCPIFKEKNMRLGTTPSLLFPGFVPDGNEAFFLLRKCFLKFGSLYYLNYPTLNFYKPTIFHQTFDTISAINDRKLKNAGKKSSPFLIGTSFGCHIIISFLEWLRDNNLTKQLDIRGIVLISPVLCQDDMVEPNVKRQKTLVGRVFSDLARVNHEAPEEIRKAMDRAKTVFRKMFTSGRDLMKFESKDLIPIFAIEDDVLGVFGMEPADYDGYFTRFLELKHAPPIQQSFLSRIPTLVLFAEGENDVLAPSSPSFKNLSNIDQLQTIFPNGQVEFVYSKGDTRKVTHSDLVFQAARFGDHLEPWLTRTAL